MTRHELTLAAIRQWIDLALTSPDLTTVEIRSAVATNHGTAAAKAAEACCTSRSVAWLTAYRKSITTT